MQRLGDSTNDHELPFRQLAGILRRRIRLIIAIAGLGTMLAAVVALIIPPKYTATAQLAVEAQPPAGRAGTSPTDQAIDTHVTLVGSRSHLQAVVEELSRDLTARISAQKASQTEAIATDSASDHSPPSTTSEVPPEATATQNGLWQLDKPARVFNMWVRALRNNGDAAVAGLEELERGIRINQERRSRIISVAFTSTSPEKATAIANRIVQLYVESQLEQKRTSASNDMARLDERIAELKFEAENAGIAVQKAIQQRRGTVSSASSEERDNDEQLRELEHRAAVTAQHYSSLLRRQKEMREQRDIVTADVDIFSLASVSDRPSSHHPILFVFPALIVFAIGGSLLAVVLEQLDRGLHSERDINNALGVVCIGLVPRLRRRHRARPHRVLLEAPFSTYTEAIRSIVATLQLTAAPRVPKVVFITSSVPKEGKTTLAVSLAAYGALVGRRVLLVDLDFRHPSISRHLESGADRGVADLLLQGNLSDEVIQRIPDLALDYLPMSRCPADPVALFALERMPRLLCELRERYDCIVVDGPPLLGITEARLFAPLADKIVFVVKWGSTRRELAQNALHLLRGPDYSDIDPPVAVSTQVDLKKHARYRYGDVGESLVKYRKYYSHSVSVRRHSTAVLRQPTEPKAPQR